MTIAELIKEVMDSSKERVKSPILGSYICSFLLFNWRPILLLIFSEESIEHKFMVIETCYINFWTWLGPLIIVCIYTFALPWFMVGIDIALKPAKQKRIKHIYATKIFTTAEKVELAREEVTLKNIESGNKDRQDLLDQIETLKTTHEQIKQADKNNIDALNEKLKESNELLSRASEQLKNENAERIRQQKLSDPHLIFYYAISDDERKELYEYAHSEPNWIFENFSLNLRKKMIKDNIVIRDEPTQKWVLSHKGLILLEGLKYL